MAANDRDRESRRELRPVVNDPTGVAVASLRCARARPMGLRSRRPEAMLRFRIVAMLAVWAVVVVGLTRLFADAAVPLVGASGLVALSAYGATRWRNRRAYASEPVALSADLPSGPRRVLLAETGLAGPE